MVAASSPERAAVTVRAMNDGRLREDVLSNRTVVVRPAGNEEPGFGEPPAVDEPAAIQTPETPEAPDLPETPETPGTSG